MMMNNCVKILRYTVLAHFTPTYDGENLLSSHDKFLQLMKEKWTKQAILLHLTVNCELRHSLISLNNQAKLHVKGWVNA